MADPICRWRNPTVKTVCELVLALPKQQMSETDFKQWTTQRWEALGYSDFFKTPYQTAKQLGLYYTSDNIFYPRFSNDISVDEATAYLKKWLLNYYVPNPYTKDFSSIEPTLLMKKIYEMLIREGGTLDWDKAKLELFGGPIGNDDILQNVINAFSDKVTVENNALSLKSGVALSDISLLEWDDTKYDRDDVLSFFNQFGQIEKPYKAKFEFSHNVIVYGAPGTGKSHSLDEKAASFNSRKTRVTFYPDYSYSKFIGSYKPYSYYRSGASTLYYDGKQSTSQELANTVHEPVIDYSFVPGPFIMALLEALKSTEPYLLLIEELNRGNAAAIFGEVFQLLDRSKGKSKYQVKLSLEAMMYLKDNLPSDYAKIESGIFLPENLYIWATMNSADQGVFPLDSAFKRRWSVVYMPLDPIGEEQERLNEIIIDFDSQKYSWNGFRTIINEYLSRTCKVTEDRLIGPYYLNKDELLNEEMITNKLLLYLRDDVLRHNHNKFFNNGGTFQNLKNDYGKGILLVDALKADLLKAVYNPPKVVLEAIPQPNEESDENIAEVNKDQMDSVPPLSES